MMTTAAHPARNRKIGDAVRRLFARPEREVMNHFGLDDDRESWMDLVRDECDRYTARLGIDPGHDASRSAVSAHACHVVVSVLDRPVPTWRGSPWMVSEEQVRRITRSAVRQVHDVPNPADTVFRAVPAVALAVFTWLIYSAVADPTVLWPPTQWPSDVPAEALGDSARRATHVVLGAIAWCTAWVVVVALAFEAVERRRLGRLRRRGAASLSAWTARCAVNAAAAGLAASCVAMAAVPIAPLIFAGVGH